ncbi:MAG: hypothetical protein ACR2GO_08590 [Candidatus Limnocylindria bacterium]
MDTTTFYAAASALCFTLLGFWWVVVQYRHAELTRDAAARRFTFLVSLHFIVPGLVSLASLLATGAMWRIAFALAGLTGIAATVAGLRAAGSMRSLLGGMHRAFWLGIPIYGLVTAVALAPDVVRTTLGIEPLQVEGLLLLVILLIGILLAWFLFTGSQPSDV